MNALRAAVLLWWFAVNGYYGYAVTTIGPFRDEADCIKARAWVAGQKGRNTIGDVSWCWWDGR